jgi:hypothetical protein
MRLLWGLAGLTLIWSLCGPLGAQPKDVKLLKGGLPTQFVGRGENGDSAKNVVAHEAVVEVTGLMEKNGLRSFKIDEKYVRDHLLDNDSGDWDKDVLLDLNDGKGERPFKRWIVPARTDNWWKEIVRRDRVAERALVAEKRQTWTYRAMIGLAVLLFAGFGYVRFDEYTHRRYTTLLRVLGVGVATSVVAGWWWAFV